MARGGVTIASMPAGQMIGVILAGGQSRRMGQDKALMPFHGRPMIDSVLEALAPVFPQTLIIGRPSDWIQRPGVRCLPDEHPGLGPLGGLGMALQFAAPIFLCGCDMPLLKAAAVRLVADALGNGQAALPRIDGWLQPLHAAYHPSCLPMVREQLQIGELSLHRLLARLDVRLVGEEPLRTVDPTLSSIRSFNRMAELESAATEGRR